MNGGINKLQRKDMEGMMNDQQVLISEKHLWSALMMTLCTTKPHIKQNN